MNRCEGPVFIGMQMPHWNFGGFILEWLLSTPKSGPSDEAFVFFESPTMGKHHGYLRPDMCTTQIPATA